MATQLYICKHCGCPDLEMPKTTIVVDAKDREVSCPNCQWKGPLSETAGIYTSEKVYDTKAVLNLLLFVTTKHAAGPIAQALEFIGMIEKDDQEGRDVIMRAALEGLIRESFVAAAVHSEEKKLGKKPAPPTTDVVDQKDEISAEEKKALS